MISNADSDCDPDSDPDIEDSSRLTAKFRVTHGSPERQNLSGSHGPGPWIQLALRNFQWTK
jgi:hypothetical protein